MSTRDIHFPINNPQLFSAYGTSFTPTSLSAKHSGSGQFASVCPDVPSATIPCCSCLTC